MQNPYSRIQADIKATKKEIKKSKLKLHHLFSPQKTSGFLNKKKIIAKLQIFLICAHNPTRQTTKGA
jgi:hypothetical protein